MTTPLNTAELIRQRIAGMPVGEPFASAAFLNCGTRASVDQTLSRLVKAGDIERVARGVFVRPEVSRFVGKVMPVTCPLQPYQSVGERSRGLQVN